MNNGEDGIQFIDYAGLSDRNYYIENNLIKNNMMAGIGMMADGNTIENYEGASIPEPIYLINNTLDGNNYGITGGANLTSFNNIITNCTATAMKNVNGSSQISYSTLWNNGLNFDNCIIDSLSLVFSDPLFISNTDNHLEDSSPCINRGTPVGSPLIDIEYTQRGTPPDIGAYENTSDGHHTLLKEPKSHLTKNFKLNQNYPNPFNPETVISYELAIYSKVNLKIYDISGRELATLIKGNQPTGKYTVTFNVNGLASGIYFYTLESGSFVQSRKMLLLR